MGRYDTDVLDWSEHQANLLRRAAGGERVNELIDWDHVIEEVRDVGLSELRSCRNLLRQALTHMLKITAWPANPAVAHWRAETAVLLTEARDRFAPSMRQRIGLAGLYDDAIYTVRAAIAENGQPAALPDDGPVALDDLVAVRPDIEILLQRLRSP